jgi:hypothetical protein
VSKRSKSSLKRRIKRVALSIKFQLINADIQSGNRLFFVTGRGKSGTTWMAKLLTSHPQLFCDPTENFGFHQDFSFQLLSDWPELKYDGLDEYLDTRIWKLLKNGLISNLTTKCDKLSVQKLGDKTPDQDAWRILDLFPKAQIIIVLRDFRDACLSWAFHAVRSSGTWQGWFEGPEKKALNNEFLTIMLNYYEKKKDFKMYSCLAREKPDQVLIVRYENLKAEPVETLRGIFNFLKVNSRDAHVKRCLHLNSFEKISGGRQPGVADPNSFYRKGIIGDWRNHFDAENIIIFKKIAGETLISAGYERDNNW